MQREILHQLVYFLNVQNKQDWEAKPEIWKLIYIFYVSDRDQVPESLPVAYDCISNMIEQKQSWFLKSGMGICVLSNVLTIVPETCPLAFLLFIWCLTEQIIFEDAASAPILNLGLVFHLI